MALNSRSPIDPRWVTHNKSVIEGLYLAQIEIYNPNDSGQTYNATTNTWTGAPTEVYSGSARVQPLTSINQGGDGFNTTEIKTVRIQIPYTAGVTADIRPNYKVRITSSPNDQLPQFIMIITDVVNSSNAWERTLLCKVDTELDPTNA